MRQSKYHSLAHLDEEEILSLFRRINQLFLSGSTQETIRKELFMPYDFFRSFLKAYPNVLPTKEQTRKINGDKKRAYHNRLREKEEYLKNNPPLPTAINQLILRFTPSHCMTEWQGTKRVYALNAYDKWDNPVIIPKDFPQRELEDIYNHFR